MSLEALPNSSPSESHQDPKRPVCHSALVTLLGNLKQTPARANWLARHARLAVAMNYSKTTQIIAIGALPPLHFLGSSE
jgi:hypothetical protein